MHSPIDRSRGKEEGFFEKWGGFGILVLPVLLAVAMVVLAVVQPKTNWISWMTDIVRAEFPGNSASPSEAPRQ